MSSLPSKEGVAHLLRLASDIATYTSQSEYYAHLVTENTRVHKDMVFKLNTAQEELKKQLENMDCVERGNIGWERRITWMFAEIARQVNFNKSSQE